MSKFRKILIFVAIFLIPLMLSSCTQIDNIKVKLGMKNKDFEYIQQNKVDKIIIQNTRDQGFRFAVTDKKAIKELYDILSSAKSVNEKITLAPDYIFQMEEGPDKIHTFKYIAGVSEKNKGNLYGGNKIYSVSNRIDNNIISSLWDIRKPKDFNIVYYKSILDVLKMHKDSHGNTEKIGININDDINSLKFILSTDLEEFKSDLKDYNCDLVNNDKEEYNTLLDVETQGYKSTIYKSIITIDSNKSKTEEKYYVTANYDATGWSIKVYTEKPKDF